MFFDPQKNLEEVIASIRRGDPVSEEMRKLAEASLKRNEETLKMDVDEWARNLARDLSKMND